MAPHALAANWLSDGASLYAYFLFIWCLNFRGGVGAAGGEVFNSRDIADYLVTQLLGA